MSNTQATPIRLLIVDDSPTDAQLIRRAFDVQTRPYRLTFVTTVYEARQELAGPPPDLALVNLALPDGRGIQLIPQSAEGPTLPVIMMTGEGNENEAVETVKAGALDYVVKSRDVLAEMPRIVERTLREWRLMQERKVLEKQLRQAQKMDSIGQLAGGIAHDFNNLLTAIIGYADMSLLELNDRASTLENLQQIRKAGLRASQLTGQLLSFARKQILSPTVINLNELLMNLERMLRRLIREDIELVILPGDELWSVKADPGLLEQVIVNLVVNARQAMPNGGKLTLETANLKVGGMQASPHAEIGAGDYVTLSISDTGLGIAEGVKNHIFEPFFTTKNPGEGTGLGLATSYGIVKQNGGHITFHSEMGKGTSFCIHLPRTLEEPENKAAFNNSERPGGNETILVVEDEAAVRGFTVKALRSLGYTVLEASNGHEALRLAKEHPGEIHLLFTDMVMPHLSGKEVAESFTQLRPGTGLLYTSGYTAGTIVHQGVLDQGVHFLQKPYTSLVLARKVREVIDLLEK